MSAFGPGTDPASRPGGGAISVISGTQVSLPVYYLKKHEVYFVTLLWQNSGRQSDLISRMPPSDLYKIMVKKVTFVGFRSCYRPNRPPPLGSAPGLDSGWDAAYDIRLWTRQARTNQRTVQPTKLCFAHQWKNRTRVSLHAPIQLFWLYWVVSFVPKQKRTLKLSSQVKRFLHWSVPLWFMPRCSIATYLGSK